MLAPTFFICLIVNSGRMWYYFVNQILTKEDVSVKRKLIASFAALCLMIAVLYWSGIGFYSSSSAVQDLKVELEGLYGTEYTGKVMENGTEDMIFAVEPKTWFLTNWNLRNALSMDYEYECKVIFTTRADGAVTSVRTITYRAYDPMGSENMAERAHLDPDSKTEQTDTNSAG